jgi:hypothetical protein
MGRALILVESLAAVLLLTALAAAWAARRPGRLRWAAPVAVAAAAVVPAGILTYALSILQQIGTVSRAALVIAGASTAAILIGCVVVIREARRAGADSARPWSVGSLAVAFAVAAVLTAITVSNLDVAVKSQIAAVRVEAGAKALAFARPGPAEGPNAAPIYHKAFASLTPRDQLPALLGGGAPAWQNYEPEEFDPNDPEQREFLAGQQRGLALLRKAAALPRCSFDRDWTGDASPVDLPAPELPQLRHGATLLGYDALARAARRDSRGALDDVAAVFGVARHVNQPLLIDLITAAAIEKVGTKALEAVLRLAPAKAEDLARLQVGPGETFRERLVRALAMEEAWGMAVFALLATGGGGGSSDIREAFGMDAFGEAILNSPLYRIFFLEDDLASYRRHLRTMRENAAKPGPAMLEGFEKHERGIRATRGGGVLAGLLLPAAVRCSYLALDGDANRDLVRLAVACTAYKAKHGKYPEKVAGLAPEFVVEVPLDPYDGRPLRLRRVKGGVVLYSIGRDRKDDGGLAWDEKKQQGDLVFRLR